MFTYILFHLLYAQIRAGDIIKLSGKTAVPADMIIVLTSLYSDGNQCYVETTNIDGETNLKLREAPVSLKPLAVASHGTPNKDMFEGEVKCEPPNKNIHNFIGTLKLFKLYDHISLSADNMLLKGSLLSNTEWVYGLAVYTGQESKVQMNNRRAPSKMSKLEKYVNVAIIIIFFAQVT